MKTFRAVCWFLVFSCSLLLEGCPPVLAIEFANDTGKPLTVSYARETVSIPAGASATLHTPIWPETFDVTTPRGTWHYQNVYPGQEFMLPRWSFVLRVDYKGRIVAMQEAHASKKMSGQPPGYPLRPKT